MPRKAKTAAAPSTTAAKATAAKHPRLTVTTLGVGHGDAILLRWEGPSVPWTCLIDGGENPETLLARLEAHEVDRIDLLILSHYDEDHIGGLKGLSAVHPIAEFWAPALPAFLRHRWLFGPRCNAALERAAELEAELARTGTALLYPLEDFAMTPFGEGGPKLSILSPPARLIRFLLTQDDVSRLFTSQPMPMGWLLDQEEPPIEQSADLNLLDAALATGWLTPESIPQNFQRPSRKGQEPGAATRAAELARDAATTSEIEPNFFGDSVLNNSSLVTWMEVDTGSQRHRLLFAGDQENWCYLFAMNPRGLQADVVKASHHGGRVYVEGKLTPHEFFGFIRPRAVMISANGRHRLPRAEVRKAAINWGAAVFCTSRRGREYVVGSPGDDVCCHSGFHCGKETTDVTLTLDADGIHGETPACHSGSGSDAGLVIDVVRHVVAPSPVLDHLFENELRKHIGWVKKTLDACHEQRVAAADPNTTGSALIDEEQIANLARQQGRTVIVPHLPTILERGIQREDFWANKTRYVHSLNRFGWSAYHWPTDGEIQAYLAKLEEKELLLFTIVPERANSDPDSLLTSLKVEGLANHADAVTHFPVETYKDVFWPAACKQLKAKWHAYRHSIGRLVFARADTPESFIGWLFQTYMNDDPLPTTKPRDWTLPPFAHRELIGDNVATSQVIDNEINTLFTLKPTALDMRNRARFFELVAKLEEKIGDAEAEVTPLQMELNTLESRANAAFRAAQEISSRLGSDPPEPPPDTPESPLQAEFRRAKAEYQGAVDAINTFLDRIKGRFSVTDTHYFQRGLFNYTIAVDSGIKLLKDARTKMASDQCRMEELSALARVNSLRGRDVLALGLTQLW